ncbi:MAG: peptidase domain protein [Frankiales bacterium]|nr:peptidase domain protein [Frankiales bacterium]MCW2586892.1 peptidase domain protein [Frankiales bacterium]
MPTRAPARTTNLSYAVERGRLKNGLRVVVLPDRTSPVVAVAVYYDVGMRSEPEGRTGFAHLFEHLMFQGSASLGKTEHFTYVQGAGGVLNGSTHLDYTNYYEVLPNSATELALFLEADRMRSVALTQDNLENQVAVVQNEIRVNVQNRPYGGFPWLAMPPVLFDSFANSHDGYGSFVDLEAATLEDAESFFRRYYAPGNAVLAVAGDVDPAQVMAWVEQYFGDIPGRKVQPPPAFSEPPLTEERRAVVHDRLAPAPALAMAWRVPDPADLETYLPYVVLAEVLTDGDAARLQARLLLKDRTATSIGGYLGVMGDPLDARDPTPLMLEVHHAPEVSADTVIASIDEEIARLAHDGLDQGEVDRTVARLTARFLREVDPVLGRATHAAVFEQQRGRAELLNELPALLAAVTAEQVAAAAGTLGRDNRAVLELRPGGES